MNPTYECIVATTSANSSELSFSIEALENDSCVIGKTAHNEELNGCLRVSRGDEYYIPPDDRSIEKQPIAYVISVSEVEKFFEVSNPFAIGRQNCLKAINSLYLHD